MLLYLYREPRKECIESVGFSKTGFRKQTFSGPGRKSLEVYSLAFRKETTPRDKTTRLPSVQAGVGDCEM